MEIPFIFILLNFAFIFFLLYMIIFEPFDDDLKSKIVVKKKKSETLEVTYKPDQKDN